VVPLIDIANDASSRALEDLFWIDSTCVGTLSRFRDFQIVSRGQTFIYRDPTDSGLDVDYVLGGTIQRVAERLRVTATLSDAHTGDVLWSERWERAGLDGAEAWIDVAVQISNRLGGRTGIVAKAGQAVAESKRARDRTAWETFLLGTEHLAEGTRAGVAEAASLLEKALTLDPSIAHAWAELALARAELAEFGLNVHANRRAAIEAAQRATDLDPTDGLTHTALGAGFRLEGDFVRAGTAFETALAIAPHVTDVEAYFAGWAATGGNPDRGIALADEVMRLNLDYSPLIARQFARAYFMAGRYRAALRMIDRLPDDALTPALRAMKASALAAVGQPIQAADAAAKAIAAVPGLSIDGLASAPGLAEAERGRLIETMRLAGFPSCPGPRAAQTLTGASRLPECTR
jgi:TolB-like protein/Tfp pilus assembly protein PilF